MSNSFDFESALKALQSGKSLNGKDWVLTSLITLKKWTGKALAVLFVAPQDIKTIRITH